MELREALQLLESGSWVSIAYVSYDKKKNDAGRIIRIPKCRITRAKKGVQQNHVEKRTFSNDTLAQNHSVHFTRNVITPQNEVRKLHLDLLFAINNQKII